MSGKDNIVYDTDDYDEAKLIADYIKWARANAIPVSEYDAEDIEEYMLRHLKAAG